MEPWLIKLQNGDSQGSWDLFSARYRPLILATIRRLLDDDDDIMDVFSNVCHSLITNDYTRLRQYSAQHGKRASVATWLTIVVRNQTIDWLRQRKRRSEEPITARTREPVTVEFDPAEYSQLKQHLNDVLSLQPPDVRLAIELFVMEQMPAADVARMVGWKNAKVVYNTVYRTLAELRVELARRGLQRDDL